MHLYNPSECVEALETMTVSNQSGESDEPVLWDPTGFVVAPSRIRLKQFDNEFHDEKYSSTGNNTNSRSWQKLLSVITQSESIAR